MKLCAEYNNHKYKEAISLKHISALIVKYLMTALILEVSLLLLTDLSFSQILWVSLVVTGISYLIGDMVILQATNNATATIADMGLTIITIYMFNFFWNRNDISLFSCVIAGVILGFGETFFHRIIRNVADDDDDSFKGDIIE